MPNVCSPFHYVMVSSPAVAVVEDQASQAKDKCHQNRASSIYALLCTRGLLLPADSELFRWPVPFMNLDRTGFSFVLSTATFISWICTSFFIGAIQAVQAPLSISN